MSDPERLTRRVALTVLTSVVLAGRAAADEVPIAERFITFDPAVTMWPIALLDRKGHPSTVAPRPGRVLLVVLWATWCPACRTDLPRLESTRHDLGEGGIDVVAVNVDALPIEIVLERAADMRIGTLPVRFDPEGRRLASPRPDGHNSPFQQFGMPILFIVDRGGLVRGYLKGSVDWSSPSVLASLRGFGEAQSH